MKAENKPRIECAAIRFGGIIHKGACHSDIIVGIIKSGIRLIPYPPDSDFGFVTDANEYVTRSEAMDIAAAAGQVKAGCTLSDKILHSDDIL